MTAHDPYVRPHAGLPALAHADGNRRRNLLVGAATLAFVLLTVLQSLDPEKYFFYAHQDRSQWRHPTLAVAVFCAIVVTEGAFLAFALRTGPGTRPWLRRLIALVLFAPWVLFSSMILMHQPAFVGLHALWTWLAELLLVVMFLSAVVRPPNRS